MDSCCPAPLLDQSLPLDLLALVAMGAMMSLGHCVGMCGPLVTAFSLAQRAPVPGGDPDRSGTRLAGLTRSLLLYHAGRVTAYAALGALLGLVGSAAGLARDARPWQAGLSMVAGATMLVLGFGLLGLLPARRWVESSRLSRIILRHAGRWARSASRWRHLVLGAANGLLPCGPVYAAAIPAAASGSLIGGAIGMTAYGVGTLPALMLLGLGTGTVARPGARWRRSLFRAGSILVLLIALQMVLRGLAAVEVVPHLRLSRVVFW